MNEIHRATLSGWAMLPVALLAWLALIALIVSAVVLQSGWPIVATPVVFIAAQLLSFGFFSVQPNEARVLVLFGKYQGTVREEGFHWANPFAVPRSHVALQVQQGREAKPALPMTTSNKYRVSLRTRNFETRMLKVNDLRGNPIEISAVVVWRVDNTAEALFQVDDYQQYIEVQSETAVRHVATSYAYDHAGAGETAEVTLRGGGEVVSRALQGELQERLKKAGVVVEEARLTHLAYTPEIAGIMLRRQQAQAVIAARQIIVQNAVSMVEMALHELSKKQVVQLDEERKAAMVGNLLVVLCGETEAQPIVNAGTLYH